MKNTAIRSEEDRWAAALGAWDGRLRAQGMAERTRRAYGVDLGQLAEWAARQGHAPEQVDARMIRRYAGVLSERRASRSTVARKLAAIRSFYRFEVDREALGASPADLVASPRRESYLPRVLKAADVALVLDAIPATTPLELRDRALFELAYAGGLRAEELTLVDLADLDADAE